MSYAVFVFLVVVLVPAPLIWTHMADPFVRRKEAKLAEAAPITTRPCHLDRWRPIKVLYYNFINANHNNSFDMTCQNSYLDLGSSTYFLFLPKFRIICFLYIEAILKIFTTEKNIYLLSVAICSLVTLLTAPHVESEKSSGQPPPWFTSLISKLAFSPLGKLIKEF